MPKTRDVRLAKSISIAGCESCRCGAIHVRLHDESGAVFAVGSMPLGTAIVFADQMNETVRAGYAAQNFVCEGTA